MLALLALLGCGGEPEAPSCSGDPVKFGVISDLRFARPEDGVSAGFDLDGITSSTNGNTGCGIGDYVDPQGSPGVDNAVAGILPILEQTEAVAAEDIVHQTINSGELLLMFELGGYEGPDDDCVSFRFLRGSGQPLLGTDLKIVGGQTFDLDTSVAPVEGSDVHLEDGVLTVHDLALTIPLQYFDVDVDLFIEDVSMRILLQEDGSFTGYFGGAFDYWQIVDMAQNSGIDQGLADAMPSLFGVVADLAPDPAGECQLMSVAFEFEGVNAFFYE